MSRAAKGRVVVVDDTIANLRVLSSLLTEAGYEVRPFPSARLGIEAVRAQLPDVALLDIDMPGMNGFEMCRLMKSDPELSAVPVIFISGLTKTTSKLEGFAVGGIDYVTKPFHAQEVLARVATHVELHRARDALIGSYERLRELELLRDSLTHMIAHDLRSPLTGLDLILDAMRRDPGITPQLTTDIDNAQECTNTMLRMVNAMLDVNRLEEAKMPVEVRSCALKVVLAEASAQLGPIARDSRLTLDEASGAALRCDPGLTARVIANLVSNALSFVSTREGRVSVRARRDGEEVEVSVIDDGPGIPSAAQGQIFEKYGQVSSRGERAQRFSSGLGLTFCKMAIEAQGGEIGVRSEPGEGSEFWFRLQAAE